jgi:hypothetical protein
MALSSINVTKFRVRSLDLDFNELSWEIDTFSGASIDVLDFTFTILRSESPEGPFDAITPPFSDRYLFIDTNINLGNIYRRYYYRIRVTEISTSAVKETASITLEPDADLVATELRKHMNLLFREFIGRRCWVLPARTFGQRCSCWNPVLQKRTRSGCRTCFDTSFVRGYLSPIEAWVNIDPTANAQQQTNMGELQQQNTTARMGFYPAVKPRDLLIEPDNQRWRIVQVNQTEQVRAPVHQEVSMHLVPKGDVEYTIPLVLEEALKDLWLSPSRNFTNPQNLENFMDEEIPGIYSLYPSTYPRGGDQ